MSHQVNGSTRHIDRAGLQQLRQDHRRLVVHERQRPLLTGRTRCGIAITWSGIRQARHPKRIAHPLRKATPHVNATQALVQKHKQWRGAGCLIGFRVVARDRHPRVLTTVPHPFEVYPWERRLRYLIRSGHALAARKRKRWILPVAVLGSSEMNSIWRGYL